MSDKTPAERVNRLRLEMVQHLEAALARAEQMDDGIASYIIQRALDEVRQALNPPSGRPPRR
jgi:hypothetical protein